MTSSAVPLHGPLRCQQIESSGYSLFTGASLSCLSLSGICTVQILHGISTLAPEVNILRQVNELLEVSMATVPIGGPLNGEHAESSGSHLLFGASRPPSQQILLYIADSKILENCSKSSVDAIAKKDIGLLSVSAVSRPRALRETVADSNDSCVPVEASLPPSPLKEQYIE